MRILPSIAVAVTVLGAAFAQSASAQDKGLLARGRYLANGPVACANCHTPRGPDMALLPNMS